MQISADKIAPPVAFSILGCSFILIGAVDSIPIGAQPLTISIFLRILLIVVGIVLVGFSIFFVWRDIAQLKKDSFASKSEREGEKNLAQSLVLGEDDVKHLFYISSDGDLNIDRIIEYARKYEITTAKLIHYSGDNSQKLLRKLLEQKINIQLLLHHPGDLLQEVIGLLNEFPLEEVQHSFQAYQLGKIRSFQRKIIFSDSISNKESCLTIRYYKESPSIRGVKLDDKYLSMGWYTHYERVKEPFTTWLYGFNNAAVNTELNWANGQELSKTFDKTFDALWKKAIPYDDMKTIFDQVAALDLKQKTN